jgi:uncharacterized protein YnzC (UPF0291/DUF896 family)
MKNIDFYNLVDEVFSAFEIGGAGAGRGDVLNIINDGVCIRLYCYTKDTFHPQNQPEDEYNWYITFYHKYSDSKDIRVTPGYEREFLENFRDEVIPIIKNINILDGLIGDYVNDSMSGNIETKLKSIRRDKTISTIL